MKLIIDVPEETFNCLKNMVKAECVDPYSLADIIVNKSKPYEERPKGDLISRIYVCPFCCHKIQVTEQFLPQDTDCEVFGAEIKGGAG